MSDRGSISLEALLSVSILLALMGYFFSIIYASLIQGISYTEATEAFLRLNHDIISEITLERELSLDYSQMDPGFQLVTFQGMKQELPIKNSAFAQPIDHVTFITDTGTKYHRPFCPTVKLSLRPILYRDAIQYYQPCKVCYPSN